MLFFEDGRENTVESPSRIRLLVQATCRPSFQQLNSAAFSGAQETDSVRLQRKATLEAREVFTVSSQASSLASERAGSSMQVTAGLWRGPGVEGRRPLLFGADD